MKIERIKKSLRAHGVYHRQLRNGVVICEWIQDNRAYLYPATSYAEAYNHLKDIGVLSRERCFSSRSSR